MAAAKGAARANLDMSPSENGVAILAGREALMTQLIYYAATTRPYSTAILKNFNKLDSL